MSNNYKAGDDSLKRVVSFAEWVEVLAACDLPVKVREEMRWAIVGFLRFCKVKFAPASVLLAKAYIEQREAQAGNDRDEELRAALRWFVTKGAYSTSNIERPTPNVE